jgi:hypothetical protein
LGVAAPGRDLADAGRREQALLHVHLLGLPLARGRLDQLPPLERVRRIDLSGGVEEPVADLVRQVDQDAAVGDNGLEQVGGIGNAGQFLG